ncbi:MAG: DUF4132 domain-containing protein, partial [Gammaproteobacteria bacterium]
AVPALYAALAKETREGASAALMTALEGLGEDLSERFTPDKLLAQARKGLKGKAPAGMAWLNLDLLPACEWEAGGPVEPEIVRWWVQLACKLKEPGGNGLFERYLNLLTPASRAALGGFVLHQFIAQDTRAPSLEEANAYAAARAPQDWLTQQAWLQEHPELARYYPQSERQLFEQYKRARLGEYFGSAISEKGILALAWAVPGHALVSAIQQFMRDHYLRRAQIEALLEAASVSNEPAVIQFILSVARRYRTASVQDKARGLVERIAERNRWTADQLADRTIPTGGLDADGTLRLDCGARAYTAALDGQMKVVLRNPDGKVVSALPEPRQDDDPAQYKEAKQQVSLCKKEVKQVVQMQTARLYEAMCAQRAWPAAEWREYLRQHPVVGRLVQRLVWMEHPADGGAPRLFRPSEDGSLLDIGDEELTLTDGGSIRLAHAALIDAREAHAWLAHFKDYKLTPLFAQMTRTLPALPDANWIDDRQGWLSDSFTLRAAFTKLGYQRAQAEDGGFFFEYRKSFASAGLAACIEFTGNALPEENVAAALKTLCFERMGAGFGAAGVALDKVPAVLLAEAWGDYHAVAAACAGFDPDWEQKVPW